MRRWSGLVHNVFRTGYSFNGENQRFNAETQRARRRPKTMLIEQLVSVQGQEFGELLANRHFLEQAAGEREFARRELAAEALAVMLQNLPHHVRRHALSGGKARTILDPLPYLSAG